MIGKHVTFSAFAWVSRTNRVRLVVADLFCESYDYYKQHTN
jgi:hypothetical protein